MVHPIVAVNSVVAGHAGTSSDLQATGHQRLVVKLVLLTHVWVELLDAVPFQGGGDQMSGSAGIPCRFWRKFSADEKTGMYSCMKCRRRLTNILYAVES